MSAFLQPEQQELASEIATLLESRGETVAVAEATAGGLISAALLQVAGASRYYRGGGVVYTLQSRTAIAGVDPATLEGYRGTTPAMVENLAASIRERLDATWGLAESGLAGPTGGRSGAAPGRTTIGISGPVTRNQVFETGSSDRGGNMVEFTTLALRLFRDTLVEAAAEV